MTLLRLNTYRWSDVDARALLDSVSDLVLLLDENGCIDWVNRAAADRLQVERDDIIGQDMKRLLREGEGAWDEESLIAQIDVHSLILEGAAHNLVAKLRWQGGRTVPVLLSASPARYQLNGASTAVICVCKDITEILAIDDFWRRESSKSAGPGD